MAHFAQLDENNLVIQTIVVDNNDCLDENNLESEIIGIAFCKNLLGGKWIQTSYNNNIRKNYAYPGFIYDEQRDAFIPPKPKMFTKWILNENTCQWEPPIPMPINGFKYFWNDNQGVWQELVTD
jgi:hypothetical protein